MTAVFSGVTHEGWGCVSFLFVFPRFPVCLAQNRHLYVLAQWKGAGAFACCTVETHAWFFSLTSMVKLTKEAEAWNPQRKALGTEIRTQRLALMAQVRRKGLGRVAVQVDSRQVSCFVFITLRVEPWETTFWEKGIQRLEFEQLPDVSWVNKMWIDFEGLYSCPLTNLAFI